MTVVAGRLYQLHELVGNDVSGWLFQGSSQVSLKWQYCQRGFKDAHDGYSCTQTQIALTWVKKSTFQIKNGESSVFVKETFLSRISTSRFYLFIILSVCCVCLLPLLLLQPGSENSRWWDTSSLVWKELKKTLCYVK